jgi:Protein of unknown function (DUF3515)
LPAAVTGRLAGRAASTRARATVLLACALLACALAAGCGSGPAQVAVPHPDAGTRRLCQALSQRLPGRLGGRTRRAVSPPSPLTAAWGDRPIVLRCGVPLPAGMAPTAELTVVNGISWFPAGSAAGSGPGPAVFTEVGRQGRVEVTVPASGDLAGPVLVSLSNLIGSVIPARPGGGL